MKQSWIIGVVSMYLVILSSEVMARGATILQLNAAFDTLASPGFVNNSASTSAASSILAHVGDFFSALVAVVFLSPSSFPGTWYYFWLLVCFPIAISFVVVVATILRGVHAS